MNRYKATPLAPQDVPPVQPREQRKGNQFGPPHPDNCLNCGARMVTERRWRRLRGTELAKRLKKHVGRGLCASCYSRKRRNGTFEAQEYKPRPARGHETWSAEELLEEYVLIRSSVNSIREAAERMGITFSRLDKALYRARKRGDDRGNAPRRQIERAMETNNPLPIVRREEVA